MTDNTSKHNYRKVSIKKEISDNFMYYKSKNLNTNNNTKEVAFQENLFNKQARPKAVKNISTNFPNQNNKSSFLNFSKYEKFPKLETSINYFNEKNLKKIDISSAHFNSTKNRTNPSKSPGRITLIGFKSPAKADENLNKNIHNSRKKSIYNNEDNNNRDNKSKHSQITIKNIKYFGINNNLNNNYGGSSVDNNGNSQVEIDRNEIYKSFNAKLIDRDSRFMKDSDKKFSGVDLDNKNSESFFVNKDTEADMIFAKNGLINQENKVNQENKEVNYKCSAKNTINGTNININGSNANENNSDIQFNKNEIKSKFDF